MSRFLPVPRDDNGCQLSDRGTELFTYRITQDTDLDLLSLSVDFKEVILHVESGDEVLYVKGTATGSATARVTAAGTNIVLPLVVKATTSFAHVAAPTGTKNISIFAWR